MLDKPSALTPIRVRGKRDAGLRARPKRTRLPHKTDDIISQSPSTLKKKRRARLTRLEELPTEVLEMIFLYSGNVNLPLVSAGLASQLSGQRLQALMMDVILRPIFNDHVLSELQLSMIESLLARRFCKWNVFQDWLAKHVPSKKLLEHAEGHPRKSRNYPGPAAWPVTLYHDGNHRDDRTRSPTGILPRPMRLPTRLLHGPWTADKIHSLECYHYANGHNLWYDEQECARLSSFNGIRDAIREQSCRALHLLINLGLDPEPDFLHMAIIDEGCNMDIVERLFQWTLSVMHSDNGSQRSLRWPIVDPLDPVLWSWTGMPAQKGYRGKGALVRSLLRTLNDPV